MSPAKSKRQQQFMGAELARKRAGKKTKTNMTEKELAEFAATKTKQLPASKPVPKGHHRMPSGTIMKNGAHKGRKK